MNLRRFFIMACCFVAMSLVLFGFTGFRAANVYNDARDIESNIKYLIDTGDLGTAPAESTLSAAYLEIIFGDNPELLAPLLEVIKKGMEETPDISLGEVASIIVTFRKDDDGNIEDVVAHIIGDFSLGRRQVNVHPDGFFQNRVDDNLMNTKQAAIKFAGRDITVWAKDETVERPQQEMIEALYSGEILLVAEAVKDRPLYFTAVFPAPRQILPERMRPHIRAILYNGSMSSAGGEGEMVALANDERSADRVLSMFEDLITSAEVTLRTKFGGAITETAWSSDQPGAWWAYELANTLEDMTITKNDKTIRLSVDYERRVVNAIMKTIERFGRDYTAIRGVQEEKMLPQEVQDMMQGNDWTPRWTAQHQWGPDWPFAAPGKVEVQRPEREDSENDSTPEDSNAPPSST